MTKTRLKFDDLDIVCDFEFGIWELWVEAWARLSLALRFSGYSSLEPSHCYTQ